MAVVDDLRGNLIWIDSAISSAENDVSAAAIRLCSCQQTLEKAKRDKADVLEAIAILEAYAKEKQLRT